MFNPLVDKFDKLSDSEIDQKISELGKKYWQTSNPDVRMQISSILEMFKEEARARQAHQRQKDQDIGENGLDSLIKIS